MREKVPRDTSIGGQQVFAPVHGQAAARNGLSNQPAGNEKTQVSRILAKLGCPRSRVQAAVLAQEMALDN